MANDSIVFPRAPITEAMLDIRIEPLKSDAIGTLAALGKRVEDRYPTRNERYAVSGGFQIQNKIGAKPSLDLKPSEAAVDGYIHKTIEGKSIFQARLDGFTYNLLKPYSKWSDFSSEAKRLWDIYREALAPETKVVRLGLRYINRIELPLPFDDFSEYFNTVPVIASKLPQELAHFFMQLVIPDGETGAYAVVNETMERPSGTKLPFILDIDAAKDVILDCKSSKVWEIYEELHDFKNRVFMESITDKTKELFK